MQWVNIKSLWDIPFVPVSTPPFRVELMAMNKINDSPKLRKLGWILLMQIHDEGILERTEETLEEPSKRCFFVWMNLGL